MLPPLCLAHSLRRRDHGGLEASDEPPDSLGAGHPQTQRQCHLGTDLDQHSLGLSLLELAETGSSQPKSVFRPSNLATRRHGNPKQEAGPGAWWEGLRLLGQAQGRGAGSAGKESPGRSGGPQNSRAQPEATRAPRTGFLG